MALPLFAVTLFVSAFLLFLVQPMIGKMILPKLGGTPQVWNTCMVFFQSALLAGYAYTHTLSTRFSVRRQLAVHAVLLGVPLLVLLVYGPFNVTEWAPPTDTNPIPATLALLALIVGLPFFVISTSAPLLQKWFTSTGHPASKDPYFLYGASNLGSLLSLFFYPFLMEPWLTLRAQAITWWVSYFVLAGMILVCAYVVWKSPLSALTLAPEGAPPVDEPSPAPAPAPEAVPSTAVKTGPAPSAGRLGGKKRGGLKGAASRAAVHAPDIRSPLTVSTPREEPMTWWRRIRWIALAAVPSSLMLGVTSFISTDLSPFPLLWVIPLALYLLSFILVYMKFPITWTSSNPAAFTPHSLVLWVAGPLSILGLAFLSLGGAFYPVLTTFFLMLFFFCIALMCHGELAVDRPVTRYLTEYFLLMSVGGMLGGVFNGILAPIIFPGVWEFPIAIAAACFVRPTLTAVGASDNWLMESFPGLRVWARDQSDQISRSMGREPDGDTYVLSYALDVILGLSVGLLAWVLLWQSQEPWGVDINSVFRGLLFLGFGQRTASSFARPAFSLVVYGIPMILAFFFSTRPLRFGIAVSLIILVSHTYGRGSGDDTLYAGRTYFGVLRVLKERDDLYDHREKRPKDEEEFANFAKQGPGGKIHNIYDYTYLMHGTTYHGRNYTYDPNTDPVDLSRLSTTYYHRYGPVGIVMEKLNWLPGPQNTYWADARMPATQVGQVMAGLGTSALPLANLVDAWSEPPFATIGLGSGTMASYARPYQHLAYYEIDEKIRDFSLPTEGKAMFTYLQGAIQRGANLEVIMGDARLSMAREEKENSMYPVLKEDPRLTEEFRQGAKDFLTPSPIPQNREKYYRVIVVDAFSSDAIPVHLVTKEAIKMYLDKLRYDGVLAVHTSNRHLDLVQPVAKIAQVLSEEYPEFKNLRVLVGKDQDQREKFLGHFSSEYVMLYFDDQDLKPARNYVTRHNVYDKSVVQWHPPEKLLRSVWTDDYSNIISIIR